MQIDLKPFNSSNHIVAASVKRTGTTLLVEYLCNDVDDITFTPYLGELKREWCLWEHTCFEMFINFKDREDYLEFNFSSSSNWNCYHLDSYREGIKEYDDVKVNFITFTQDSSVATLQVEIEFTQEDVDSFDKFGITTILNDSKTEEFWSICHADTKPDFHSKKTFQFPF